MRVVMELAKFTGFCQEVLDGSWDASIYRLKRHLLLLLDHEAGRGMESSEARLVHGIQSEQVKQHKLL
jgi:hypothetical protein